jgi:hypothetical protein
MIYAHPVAENKKDGATTPLRAFLTLAALWGGFLLWLQGYTAGWFSHDTIAVVTAKDWSIGEYKTCTEQNSADMKEDPQLVCSSVDADGEPKRFKVSFYGETYKEELKDKASKWVCGRLQNFVRQSHHVQRYRRRQVLWLLFENTSTNPSSIFSAYRCP